MTHEEIEARINELFDNNYEILRFEGGQSLSANVIQSAREQVLFYWRKLNALANKVTDTEVKLTLPDQITPDGRRFTIEGIVDIVSENDETWMYDIKTHNPDYIKGNTDLYEKQLNIYAHIWERLRENELDHTAVISTAFPAGLKAAIDSRDDVRVEHEMQKWQPVIEIPYDHSRLADTITDFAKVVDKIESNCFEPKSVDALKEKQKGTTVPFATYVCRNCDTRFSCESYRSYALQSGAGSQAAQKKYFDDYGDATEHEAFIAAGLQKSENTAGR